MFFRRRRKMGNVSNGKKKGGGYKMALFRLFPSRFFITVFFLVVVVIVGGGGDLWSAVWHAKIKIASPVEGGPITKKWLFDDYDESVERKNFVEKIQSPKDGWENIEQVRNTYSLNGINKQNIPLQLFEENIPDKGFSGDNLKKQYLQIFFNKNWKNLCKKIFFEPGKISSDWQQSEELQKLCDSSPKSIYSGESFYDWVYEEWMNDDDVWLDFL
jgi:hypothetical protein